MWPLIFAGLGVAISAAGLGYTIVKGEEAADLQKRSLDKALAAEKTKQKQLDKESQRENASFQAELKALQNFQYQRAGSEQKETTEPNYGLVGMFLLLGLFVLLIND